MGKKRRFSDELRRAIEDSGQSRYEICKATDVDQGNLSRFVNHGGGLSMETIDKLYAYLRLRLVAEDRRAKSRKKGG